MTNKTHHIMSAYLWQGSAWVPGDLPLEHVQESQNSKIVEHLKADVAALEEKLRAAQVRLSI